MSEHATSHRREDPPLIDPALLELLLGTGEAMSVEALALRRNMTRQRILRELDRLRAAGCRFDEHPQHGLQLVEAGLGCWVDYLASLSPQPHVPPRIIEVYRQTRSTQDVARRIVAHAGARSDRALAVADEQTAGRGRLGRRWMAPAGTAVTFSRVSLLHSLAPGAAIDRLTFAASVGVAQVLERLLGDDRRADVTVKWPNDVCVAGRKIAGILVETCQLPPGSSAHAGSRSNADRLGADPARAAILGVGLNVGLQSGQLPPELRERATSLAMRGVRVDRLGVLGELVRALDWALEAAPVPELLRAWRRRCTMLHQHLRVLSRGQQVEGQVIDLDPHEGLLLRTSSGEILHLPVATTTVL